MQTKLMKMEYFDPKAETRLETYADTIVLEQEGYVSYIAAVRFGGYPESVKGMSEAIYGGGSITVEINGELAHIHSRVKQYRKELSHDGIYAEATLMIQDEEQSTDSDERQSGRPRKCYLFCEQGNSDRLFEELDKKTSVPLISEFKEYVLSELQNRGILMPLKVISCTEKFDVWLLSMSEDEKNIISVANDGLRSGAISIPGSDGKPFPAIRSVTQYLNSFGIMIAERIKNQFQPLFDPATERLSPEILAVNEHIQKTAGYSLYDAQLAVCEAHKRCLERKKATLCIAECGSGKTKIGLTALHAYQQQNAPDGQPVKHFNIVLCPSHMVKKWIREIEESLPDTFAVAITSIEDLRTTYSAYEQDNKTYVTRGCAEYVEWLGQKENPNGNGWATGARYGEKILSILKAILAITETETEEEEMRYNKISEMPDWAQPTIIKMVDIGLIGGSGTEKDENDRPADLDLSYDMLRVFVTNDRAGFYGE